MFLLFILIIVERSSAISVALLPSTIAWLNWGVVFRKGPTILNGVSNHKHTFSIPDPQLLYDPIQSIDCSKTCGLSCDAINELVEYVNGKTIPLMEEYRRRVYSWLLALPDVDVLPQRSGDRTKRSEAIQSSCARQKVNNKRKRRASIDGNFCSRLKKSGRCLSRGSRIVCQSGANVYFINWSTHL
jgi:hypothetical protein